MRSVVLGVVSKLCLCEVRIVAKSTRIVAGLFFVILTAWSLPAQEKQPVYVYLFSRFSDFVNMEMTERRIRDTVSLVEKYRREYPKSQVSATVLFSGALSQALAERNAKTRIKDYVLEAARRGVIEIGYDGTDEPTYSSRPLVNLGNIGSPEDRWRLRGEAAEQFLTEARDPSSGEVEKGKPGGLKAMQEVFGEAVCVKGLNVGIGGDSEYIHHLRRYNTQAIMWGLPDPNPALNIHGYRGSVEQFGKAMSPIPNSSPELNWMDNFLRLSETSDAAVRVVSGHEGPEVIKKLMDALDRSHVRILHVELSDVRMYLSQLFDKGTVFPPLKLAYDHPDHPTLPLEAFAGSKQLEENQANQEALMRWLAGDFMAANPGSHFVSSTDLAKMSPSNVGQDISVEELQKAAGALLKAWGNDTYLPDYISVGNQYLSLADTFQVLCDVLAEQHRTGKRPQIVRIHSVYGPLQLPEEHGPALGAVTGASVARTASDMARVLKNETWKPVPTSVVPMWVDIESLHLTTGQFLRLMLESLVAPSPSVQIKVKMTNNFSSSGLEYPKQRLPIDQGGTWTFRPAPLNIAPPTQASN
jgi:hypothetical protein